MRRWVRQALLGFGSILNSPLEFFDDKTVFRSPDQHTHLTFKVVEHAVVHDVVREMLSPFSQPAWNGPPRSRWVWRKPAREPGVRDDRVLTDVLRVRTAQHRGDAP